MKPVLYVVTLEVHPEAEHDWLLWMQGLHIPEVLCEPGFVRCRLWKDTVKAPDDWVRYVVQYELTGQDAVEQYVASDAAKRLRADGVTRFGEVMRASRAILTEVASFG